MIAGKTLIRGAILVAGSTALLTFVFYGGPRTETVSAAELQSGETVTSSAPLVSVLTARPTTARPRIQAYGDVRSIYRTVVSAEVSGELMAVSSRAHSGYRVAKGDILMTLDDSRYVQALAQAKSELGNARLRVVEEELRAQQAVADWGRIEPSGTPSEFLLRQPQRRAAELEVLAAEAAVVEAEKNLQRTQIRAPFDGVVIQRMAALGRFVQPGDELIELDSDDAVELRLPLQSTDWALLPTGADLVRQRWPVELTTNHDPPQRWQGWVSRVEQHVMEDTRQRSLIVEVRDPLDLEPPLWPGTFVRAGLEGLPLEGVLDLPASALTDQDELWFVDADGLLAKTSVQPRVAAEDRILVTAPADLEGLDVLLHPMTSYLPGLPVIKELNHADVR